MSSISKLICGPDHSLTIPVQHKNQPAITGFRDDHALVFPKEPFLEHEVCPPRRDHAFGHCRGVHLANHIRVHARAVHYHCAVDREWGLGWIHFVHAHYSNDFAMGIFYKIGKFNLIADSCSFHPFYLIINR